MLKVRNLIKIIFLITMAVLIQLEVIREKGHWIPGGNLAFPFLVAMLLWYLPSRFKDFKGGFKNVDKN
nr:MAG TPA: hypothetical protein [Caudoviricetes sp.]